MKKLTLISLFVLSFFSISACSSFDSPSTVVKKFYSYIEAGKVNDAYELITKDGKEMLQKYSGVSVLSDLTRKIKSKNGINEIKIKNEEITGDTAKVYFELWYGNGTKKDDSEELIKENGAWHITVSK